MKLLCVDASAPGREAIATALRGTRHTVEILGTLDGALRRLAEGRPDVVAFAAPRDGADFARRVRASQAAPPYLLFLTAVVAPASLDPVLDAGVDDFLRMPIVADELRARIDCAERRRRAAAAPRTALTFHDERPADQLTQCATWQAMPSLIASEIAGIIGCETALGALPARAPGKSASARIVCSIPAEQAEVVFSLTMAAEQLARLCETLLGSPADDALTADFLCEMSNGVAGAFKRAALADGLSFTLGLPAVERLDISKWNDGPTARAWAVSSSDPAAKVLCHAEIRRTQARRINAAQLCEGMVLATDLVASTGALIAANGTRITASSAERLVRFLGPKHLVQIAEGAAG
jgi:CheY-like chemotaxis protein